MDRPEAIEAMLRNSRRPAQDVLELIGEGDDVIAGLANGEPMTVVDAIEAGADSLRGVRIHQMFPLRNRRYFHGEVPNLRHVSYFLSPHLREAFHEGTCDLVPNNFSDVPRLMREATKLSLLIAAASPPDRHGFFSLGPDAEYSAALAGEMPIFLEANAQMPRTFGENQIHVRDIAGWCEADYPLVEVPRAPASPIDIRIAELVAERIRMEPHFRSGSALYRIRCWRCSRIARTSASTPSCSARVSSTWSSQERSQGPARQPIATR